MSTLNLLLVIGFGGLIVGILLGYIWCYTRFQIWNLKKVVDITADIIAERMTPEEAIKEIKKLDEQ